MLMRPSSRSWLRSFILKGLVQDLLFLLKDDLSLSRVSGVPLHSPLSVFWVCVVCSLHLHVVDPGSDTCNFNCHRAGKNNSIWTLPMWGHGAVFTILDPHLIPGHKFVYLVPKGEWHTLSCTNLVTWFITLPSCSICCEISSPHPWDKFVDTCFIMGGGLPYTISYGE